MSARTPDPYTEPDFDSAALITIDTQRDVLDGGRFEIAGTSDALAAMAELARSFRAAQRPIVHVVRLYRGDGANADLCRRAALERGLRALTPGSEGSQLADELLPQDGLELDAQLLLDGAVQRLGPLETVLYKPRWGAFYGTPLDEHVRALGVSTLVFCGCNFPNCPRTSIYEASERDFRTVLARDALSGLYERGERELAGIGVRIMDSDQIAGALTRTTTEGDAGAAGQRPVPSAGPGPRG
jgi:nicotinamidase-related amidase